MVSFAYTSDDIISSMVVVGQTLRTSHNHTQDEVSNALKEDRDINSLKNLLLYLTNTARKENGHLNGKALQNVQKYWKEIVPKLEQKLGKQKQYTSDLVATITESLSLTFENKKVMHSECIITTYNKPIKINELKPLTFKGNIQNIFTALVDEYHLRLNNKYNPFPINIFPHGVDNYLNDNLSYEKTSNDTSLTTIIKLTDLPETVVSSENTKETIQDPIPYNQNTYAEYQTSISNSNHLTAFSYHSDPYIQQLEEEDKDLFQLTYSTDLCNSSRLYESSMSSGSDSQTGSGTTSLIESTTGSEDFSFTTPPKQQFPINKKTLNTFKNECIYKS